MCGRVIWLALLAALLVLAGSGTGRLHAAIPHHASPCASMIMGAERAPAPAHQHPADGCGMCGIDCPMHCAAVGTLPASPQVPSVGRAAYPDRGRADTAGWPPRTEHGPPRPLA